jgi:hypothetical protein
MYKKGREETAVILGLNFIGEKKEILFDLIQSKERSM